MTAFFSYGFDVTASENVLLAVAPARISYFAKSQRILRYCLTVSSIISFFVPFAVKAEDCVKPFTYLSSGEFPIELEVIENKSCTVYLWAVFSYRKVSVAENPKHGVAGVQQKHRPAVVEPAKYASFVYIPNRNFVGEDIFKIHVVADGLLGATVDQILDAKAKVIAPVPLGSQ